MNGTAHFKQPISCTEEELREFARLVCQGFEFAAEGLECRIRDAKWLGFHYTAGDTLGAVAAIKAPDEGHREEIFRKADARVSSSDYELELGWVFVVPAHRGRRIAGSLCQPLLERVAASSVFATTRTNNITMMKILHALGFTRTGRPYPRRDEELVLFLRPRWSSSAP